MVAVRSARRFLARVLFVLASLFGLYLFSQWAVWGLADGSVSWVEAVAMVVAIVTGSYLWLLLGTNPGRLGLTRERAQNVEWTLLSGILGGIIVWLAWSTYMG